MSLSALLPAPPTQLTKYRKVIWFVKEVAVQGFNWLSYHEAQQIISVEDATADIPADRWTRFQIVASNNSSVERADDQVFTIDIVNYTNGAIDNSWTTQDYQGCFGQINTFITSLAPFMSPDLEFTDIRAYAMAFAAPPPDLAAPPAKYNDFAPSGPPQATYPVTHPGTGALGGAWQVSSTITELTPDRKHWGRLYLPSLADSCFGPGGRLTTTAVDAFANYYNSMVDGLGAADFWPVVPVTRNNKLVQHMLQQVSGVQCDDVPDIQRRRRPRSAAYYKRITA